MNYCIYKMRFSTPLHCGRGDGAVDLTNNAMTLKADTLFSALCSEADISNCADELISAFKNGDILLSDTFPFYDEQLYLPVPICPLKPDVKFDVGNRKKIKAVKWLPACDEAFSGFHNYINSGNMFSTDNIKTSFAKQKTDAKNCIGSGNDDTKPFDVSSIEFEDKCGLYGIIACSSQEIADMIISLLKRTGISGIGGQVSRGYGKFSLELISNDNEYAGFITNGLENDSSSFVLLTSSLPNENELEMCLEGAYFNLIRRGGLSYSLRGSMVKKHTQYYLSSGSVLKHRFSGDIYTVGKNEKHDIYRYSKPLLLGVNL